MTTGLIYEGDVRLLLPWGLYFLSLLPARFRPSPSTRPLLYSPQCARHRCRNRSLEDLPRSFRLT